MKRLRPFLFAAAVILVVAAAFGTRWKAVTTLNIDYDEDDYLRAAQEYTAVFRKGPLSEIMNTNYRPEHPPLSKLVVGLSLLADPEKPLTPDKPTSAGPNQYLPRDLLRTGRLTNAIFGILSAGLLALVNPLGGLLLAVHAWTIKYTSQIMLEALPALTSLAAVLTYLRWRRGNKPRLNVWLAASAVFLGLTAASKYLYGVVALAILADWLIGEEGRESWRKTALLIGLWGILAVAVFFLFDPYLWPDPVGRLKDSILYHAAYSQASTEVQESNYPVWQQLNWLSTSPLIWQRNAFYISIDPWIAVLAVFGLAGTWRKHRVFILWLGIAFFFLLIWPTKWPQYLVTLSVPLSLSAAEGLRTLILSPVYDGVRRLISRKRGIQVKQKSQLNQALPWLIPGTIAFLAFTVLPLLYQVGVSLTDFNSVSIRDGLTGGIWRSVWGGISGNLPVELQEFPFRAKEVHYTGMANFAPVLNYLSQQGILVINILWTVLSVTLQVALGVFAALLLWQKGIKFRKGWQALFILPWAIPEMIGALMWANVFAPETGWLALAVQKYGEGAPFSFLMGWESSSSMWLVILLIAGVWYGFPFMLLASSAGLKLLPSEAYDAAQLDGANAFTTFRYVTWPLLLPLILPAIIVRGIFAFNQFYLFQAFRIGSGTLATLSYNFFNPSGFFINGQFSISAVINLITVIILFGFVVLFNRWSKAGEGVTYA